MRSPCLGIRQACLLQGLLGNKPVGDAATSRCLFSGEMRWGSQCFALLRRYQVDRMKGNLIWSIN